MSKSEKTKAFIIEKAAPLFNTKGYAGTSLSDLTDITGLTKGAIYGNFESKDDVATAVFEYNISKLNERFDKELLGKSTATDKLNAYLSYYRNNWKRISERGGCPILNASVEADDNLPFLKNNVQLSIKKWAQRFISILNQGKADGEFNTNIEPAEYAYTFIALIEGGIMLSKITNSEAHLLRAINRIQIIINSEIIHA